MHVIKKEVLRVSGTVKAMSGLWCYYSCNTVLVKGHPLEYAEACLYSQPLEQAPIPMICIPSSGRRSLSTLSVFLALQMCCQWN